MYPFIMRLECYMGWRPKVVLHDKYQEQYVTKEWC